MFFATAQGARTANGRFTKFSRQTQLTPLSPPRTGRCLPTSRATRKHCWGIAQQVSAHRCINSFFDIIGFQRLFTRRLMRVTLQQGFNATSAVVAPTRTTPTPRNLTTVLFYTALLPLRQSPAPCRQVVSGWKPALYMVTTFIRGITLLGRWVFTENSRCRNFAGGRM